MPVTNVHTDTDALTMLITAEFAAPIERVWQVWEDPRQLERWWGPPSFPATVVEHDLSPGGTVAYYMTGPDGEQYHGWWRIEDVDAPRGLRFEDGFANADGTRNEEMPTGTATVSLHHADGRTTMTIESRFPSREAMDQLLAMGMEEGMSQALGQVDALVA